jgi:hypothetical protein
MAAATLVLGVQQVVTTGSAGNVRLVNLPTGTRWVKVQPRTTAGKVLVGFSGDDDDAIGASAYDTVQADTSWSQFVGGHGPTLGLASTGASVEFECTALADS